jgi:hypothetical protein
MRHNIFIVTIVAGVLISCAGSKKSVTRTSPATVSIPGLHLLDEYVIPHNFKYDSTLVGGLSGIDYDVAHDRYFIISDERSFTSPARFYTATIKISNNKIDTLLFTSVHSLKQPDGSLFPSFVQNAQRTPDPESIRYNPKKNRLVWTSEGDRAVRQGKMIYQNPYVYEMDLQGNFKDSFVTPPNLHMQPVEKGPRENGVFEGSTFDKDYRFLYVSMEEPVYEDGPTATVDYAGAPIRITKFDTKTYQPVAQYAYPLDALAYAPKPSTGFYINGVDEILCIGKDRFLVMERSYSTGVLKNTIKIFMADLAGATDVSTMSGLHLNKTYQPAVKKLLLNLDDLNRYIDNVEGMTLGPVLANGHQSLVLIADNNFNALEKSQVFLFEIIP